ncbi:MAG: hypothetical protein IEMM0002_0707 [bacterium]|nr:MAG: hypothetical protein IEMM0002_0707 [bacterium]
MPNEKSDEEMKKLLEEELRKQNHDLHLERVKSIYKFHFFFAGLVFAILSFAIQFPVTGSNSTIRELETVSWALIAATGLLALKQIGGFSLEDTDEYHSGLSKNWRKTMWFLFVLGLSLLIFVKSNR